MFAGVYDWCWCCIYILGLAEHLSFIDVFDTGRLYGARAGVRGVLFFFRGMWWMPT